MDCTIWFCNDGCLRAKLKDSSEMISLKFLQEQKELNDMQFWFSWWDTISYFEEGLTVGNFLKCIEPWAEFWGAYTGKNIVSYIRESKQPYVPNKKESQYEPFDWIELSYSTKLKPEVLYDESENTEEAMQDFDKWISEPKTIALSGSWYMLSHYELLGYTKGKDDRFSTEGMRMNHMYNVPLILNQKNNIHLENWSLKRYFGKDYNWATNNQFGLCEIKRKDYNMQYLVANHYHSIKDIITGFFFWMYETPYERDDFITKLSDMIDEIDKGSEYKTASQINGHNVYQVGEEPEEDLVDLSKYLDIGEDSVEVIKGSSNKSTDEIIKLNTQDKEEPTIKIMPGAFDDLMLQYVEGRDFWEQMLEKAKDTKDSNDNSIIRVTDAESAKPLENRVNSVLLKKLDKKAVPKPTDFKKEIR